MLNFINLLWNHYHKFKKKIQEVFVSKLILVDNQRKRIKKNINCSYCNFNKGFQKNVLLRHIHYLKWFDVKCLIEKQYEVQDSSSNISLVHAILKIIKKVHTAPLSGTNLIPKTDLTVLNIIINDIKVWAKKKTFLDSS